VAGYWVCHLGEQEMHAAHGLAGRQLGEIYGAPWMKNMNGWSE